MESNFNPKKNSDDNQFKFPWGDTEEIKIPWDQPHIDSHVEGRETPSMWEIWDDDWEDLESDAQC